MFPIREIGVIVSRGPPGPRAEPYPRKEGAMQGPRVWMLLIAVVMLTGCGAMPLLESPLQSSPTPEPTPTPIVTPAPPPLPWVIGICLDISGSYPREHRLEGQKYLRDQLLSLVRPGFPGAKVFLRKIMENSYSPTARIGEFSIPAVPTPPPTPMPLLTPSNPLDRREWSRKATWTPEAFERLRADYERDLRKVQAQVQNELRPLESFDVENPAPRSDIWGCIASFSETIARVPGSARWLLLVTDLEMAGVQQKLSELTLPRVFVRVLFFHCTQARVCEERQRFWRDVFLKSGASDFRIYRMGEEPSALFDLK